MTIPDKPGRRWLHFSLRSLFLLMAVVAVSLAWLGWQLERAKQQRIAMAALEKMGCSVGYGGDDGFGDADSGSPTVLERLTKLLGEDESRTVTWVYGQFSQITDAGLAHVGGLTQLVNLNLIGTQVTDAGLGHLRGLTQLQALHLDGTQVTGAGMVHLRRLTKLRYLTFRGTKITDAGLVHLQELTQLIELDLDGTRVTAAEVQRLQEALPNCKIHWHP